MRWIFKSAWFFLGLTVFGTFASCSSSLGNDNEELVTQPVTNNPLIVPGYGSSPPGLGTDDQSHQF